MRRAQSKGRSRTSSGIFSLNEYLRESARLAELVQEEVARRSSGREIGACSRGPFMVLAAARRPVDSRRNRLRHQSQRRGISRVGVGPAQDRDRDRRRHRGLPRSNSSASWPWGAGEDRRDEAAGVLVRTGADRGARRLRILQRDVVGRAVRERCAEARGAGTTVGSAVAMGPGGGGRPRPSSSSIPESLGGRRARAASRGTFARSGSCEEAEDAIERARELTKDVALRERVDLADAECAVAAGRPVQADAALVDVLKSKLTLRGARARTTSRECPPRCGWTMGARWSICSARMSRGRALPVPTRCWNWAAPRRRQPSSIRSGAIRF